MSRITKYQRENINTIMVWARMAGDSESQYDTMKARAKYEDCMHVAEYHRKDWLFASNIAHRAEAELGIKY